MHIKVLQSLYRCTVLYNTQKWEYQRNLNTRINHPSDLKNRMAFCSLFESKHDGWRGRQRYGVCVCISASQNAPSRRRISL